MPKITSLHLLYFLGLITTSGRIGQINKKNPAIMLRYQKTQKNTPRRRSLMFVFVFVATLKFLTAFFVFCRYILKAFFDTKERGNRRKKSSDFAALHVSAFQFKIRLRSLPLILVLSPYYLQHKIIFQ